MLEQDVVRLPVGHLICEDLLVDCPRERFVDEILEVGDSLHQVCIFGVVGVDDTDEMLLGQALEEVEDLLDHLEVMLLVVRDG